MKNWRLISGILSIVLSVFVLFQSALAGLANSMEANGESGGSAGLMVSIVLLAGGIVSIVTRKYSKGGCIATAILFLLGALFGFLFAGQYSDLNIWAGWCLICGGLSVYSIVKESKSMN